MKIWVDDIREAPKGWFCAKSVNEAKNLILEYYLHIDEISLDHDAGNYVKDGGDYIKLLDWLETVSKMVDNFGMENITFHIHSMNPVGRENMLRIIKKNGWRYK